MKKNVLEVDAGGEVVRITNPDRIIFPKIGATKRDLVAYYRRLADRVLPNTRGRAMVMHRFPRGVTESGFYQKRAPENRPAFVKTMELPSPANEGPIEYVLGDNLATLFWLVNLGAFEMNPWLSLAMRPEEPTHAVVDLDPMDGQFADVCHAALLVKSGLESRGLQPAVKTSGKSGIHVSVSVPPGSTFPEVRHLLAELGRELDGKHPSVFALEERIAKREGMIYYDSNQNGYGATIAAAYSVRPTPTATVSMPLTWKEVESCPDPLQFTIKTPP